MSEKAYNQIDFDKINEMADPELTFREVGMHIEKGAIRCPGHMMTLGREDRKIGNCRITKYGCYCFSCGRGYSTIQSVALFLGINSAEAALMVASINSIDAYVEVSKKTTNKKSRYRRLTIEEKKLLGLGSYSRSASCVVGTVPFSEKNKQLPKGYFLSKTRDENGDYLLCKSVPISFTTLENDARLCSWHNSPASANPDFYHWIICEKIKERYYEYSRVLYKLQHPLQHLELIDMFAELNWNPNNFIQPVSNILFRLKNLYIEFDGDAEELDKISVEYFSRYA